MLLLQTKTKGGSHKKYNSHDPDDKFKGIFSNGRGILTEFLINDLICDFANIEQDWNVYQDQQMLPFSMNVTNYHIQIVHHIISFEDHIT